LKLRISRRPEIEEEENLNRWLLTYADMISLLLAFFVLMYSMVKVDAEKFQSLQNELAGVFGPSAKPHAATKGKPTDQAQMPNQLQQFDAFGKSIVLIARKTAPDSNIDVLFNDRGLTVRLPDDLLFESGSSQLKSAGDKFLDELGPAIKTIQRQVSVEGHTDNTPISSSMFPSNWELSTARAATVVRYLTEKCGVDPKRLTAVGFGEYKSIASNKDQQGRAKNRRVEIVLLFNDQEQASFKNFARFHFGDNPQGYTLPVEEEKPKSPGE